MSTVLIPIVLAGLYGVVMFQFSASVVAHELGHVALGHIRRRMIDFSGQNAVRAALGALLSRLLPGLGGFIASIIGNLLMAKLSRRDEYEADEYASALMIKSGLGIEPQISMFKKLDEISNLQGTVPAWLMSHPPTHERIDSIKKIQAKIYHR